jgi:catechol 2,3-dioxygenase-like lactoylglutathione lyase family enzyme
MLKDARVGAAIPTQDLARARQFYEGKLGLTPDEDLAGGAIYRCAEGTAFLVFPSSGKSSGTHTQLGFDVQDVEAEAAALAAQGVTPEPVEMPGFESENGIVEQPDGRGFWLKDPDGNLLGVFQRSAVRAPVAG